MSPDRVGTAAELPDELPDELTPEPDPSTGRAWSFTRVLTVIAVAALIVAVVRVVFVQSFVIPSASMRPLLQVGDRVLVSRLDYRLGEVRHGDVIVFNGEGVFEPPADGSGSPLATAGRAVAGALGAPVGESDYVKRVIGLPGERIVCCDAAGAITVDGRALSEPYLGGKGVASGIRFDIRVPAGRLWVMGDNRDDSGDSRAHLGDPGGGTVPLDHVIGRVVTVWWPWGRATGVGRTDQLTAPSR
ncbi:MAG TPA: signal peptidase I [Kineosporiaceae bacterium]|nr:signal peptidase I [Kineosporiaceae bacterium]